jgi:tetratricopeptide (TPR) repeat protein
LAQTTKCTRCKATITGGDRYCPECGSKLDWGAEGATELQGFLSAKPQQKPTKEKSLKDFQCEFCGNKNKKGATFCESCGAVLPAAQKTEEETGAVELLFEKEKPQEIFPVQDEEKVLPEQIKTLEPIVEKQSVVEPIYREPAQTHRKIEPQPDKKPIQKTHKPQPKIDTWKIYVAAGVFIAIVLVLFAYNQNSGIPASIENAVEQKPNPNAPTMQHLQELEQFVIANSTNPDALLQYANALYDARSFPRAVEYYNKYLAMRPNDVNAIVDKGICVFENGNGEEAIATMKQGLIIDPNHQKAYFNIAIISLSTNNPEQAKEYFTKAIALDPNNETGKRAQEFLESHLNN